MRSDYLNRLSSKIYEKEKRVSENLKNSWSISSYRPPPRMTLKKKTFSPDPDASFERLILDEDIECSDDEGNENNFLKEDLLSQNSPESKASEDFRSRNRVSPFKLNVKI